MKNNRMFALILMIIIVGFLNADQNVMNSTLTMIESEFHVNDVDIGFMSGMFTLLGAVISIVWGYLTDRKNRKMLFTLSILIGQVPCLLTAFVTNYDQFFWTRMLTGIGVGVSFPTVFSLIGDMFDEKHRAAAVTWMVSFMGFGQIIGQVMGGYVGPVSGWRLPFLLTALPGLVILPFFWFLVEEPGRGSAEESLQGMLREGYLYTRTIRFSDYIQLMKIKTNVFLFLQGIIGTIPWGAIPLFLVKFLHEDRGYTIQQATTVFLFFGIGTTVGTVLGGIWGGVLLKKKAAYLPLLCAITTLTGALMILLIFATDLGRNVLFTIVTGFIASCVIIITNPNVKTMLLDVNVPENRGAIFSIFNLTDSVGTGIGKYVGGILSVSLGMSASLSISAAVWLPVTILLFVMVFTYLPDMKIMQRRLAQEAERIMGSSQPVG